MRYDTIYKIAVAAILVFVGNLRADDPDLVSALEQARRYSYRWQTTVCHAETYGVRGRHYGTAIISTAYGDTMLVTVRHLLENQDSIKVTVVTCRNVDECKSISFTRLIYPDSIRGFVVPDTLRDIAVMRLTSADIDTRDKADGFEYYVLPRSDYLSMSDIFVGLTVIICGYPLDTILKPMLPLIRRGCIAGIHEPSKTILLDAQISQGSSGSAVFLDMNSPAAIELSEETGKWFVGLVHGCFMAEDTVKDERTGIGLVVPAEVLAGIMDAFERKTGH